MVENFRDDICCVIFSSGKRYNKLAKIAVESFKIHNPNIKLFFVNDDNFNELLTSKRNQPVGIIKYMVCYEIAKKNNFKRVINLGADTITCAYLSEFIENTDVDILATLDYPYTLISGGIQTPPGDTHVNADVVCFNNLEALLDVIKAASNHSIYFEQGGLNEIIWTSNKYKTKIVDGPYKESSIVYNSRSKGNICFIPGQPKPWKPYIQKFYTNNNKLYTHDNKQIKVFHFCEGFGCLEDNEFLNLINLWIFDFFNKETKIFFKENCNTGEFFEGKYEL